TFYQEMDIIFEDDPESDLAFFFEGWALGRDTSTAGCTAMQNQQEYQSDRKPTNAAAVQDMPSEWNGGKHLVSVGKGSQAIHERAAKSNSEQFDSRPESPLFQTLEPMETIMEDE